MSWLYQSYWLYKRSKKNRKWWHCPLSPCNFQHCFGTSKSEEVHDRHNPLTLDYARCRTLRTNVTFIINHSHCGVWCRIKGGAGTSPLNLNLILFFFSFLSQTASKYIKAPRINFFLRVKTFINPEKVLEWGVVSLVCDAWENKDALAFAMSQGP